MPIKGYYINLGQRNDRRKHMENLKKLYPFFSKVERMDAIKSTKSGALGCSLSHIKALQLLLKEHNKNHKYFIILEDDFEIINNDNFNKFTESFDKIKDNENWDLLTLTPKGKKYSNSFELNEFGFNRICNSLTTSGYIIKKSFIKKLINQIKIGVLGITNIMLSSKNISTSPYHCDQIWKPLQIKYNFIYYSNLFGGQLTGYSDIEKKKVNYNKKFLLMEK